MHKLDSWPAAATSHYIDAFILKQLFTLISFLLLVMMSKEEFSLSSCKSTKFGTKILNGGGNF